MFLAYFEDNLSSANRKLIENQNEKKENEKSDVNMMSDEIGLTIDKHEKTNNLCIIDSGAAQKMSSSILKN